MKRILVADDTEAIRNLASRILESKGNKVDSAEDGQEAIDMMIVAQEQNQQYDAVVTDISMPRKSGLDVLQYAKKHYNLPVLVMSGERDKGVIKNVYDYKGVFLEKPFRKADFYKSFDEMFMLKTE